MNPQSPWLFDETQHTGADFSDPKVVQDYDKRMHRLRDIPREIEAVRNALQLDSTHTLIDLGAGTGEFTVALSEYCREVIAVDISPAMLDFARQRAESRNRHNIRYVQAGYLTYEHSGEKADAVLTQFALHHLPDFWKAHALRRIHSFLKPGGRLFLKDIVFPSGLDDYGAFFDRFVEQIRIKAGDDMAQGATNHIKKEFSTLDWILEGMIRQAGFTLERIEYNDQCIAVYMCVK